MVRIGTWNLETLFRSGDDAGPSTQDAYGAKLNALAETIRESNRTCWRFADALADLADWVGGDWNCETAHVEGGQGPFGSATCRDLS